MYMSILYYTMRETVFVLCTTRGCYILYQATDAHRAHKRQRLREHQAFIRASRFRLTFEYE